MADSGKTKRQGSEGIEATHRQTAAQETPASRHKRGADALLNGEKLWRSLIEAAPNFVVIVGKDCRVQFINGTQPQHSKDEVVGKPFADFLPPQDRNRITHTIRDVIEGGHSQHYEASGPGIDAEAPAWFSTTVSPIRVADEVVGACLICTDITEHKQVEAALRQSVEFNQTVLSASPLGIATYRSDGRCVLANEAMPPMVGATTEQVLSQNFRQIQSWKVSGLVAVADEVLSKGIHARREIHVVSSFGKELWLDCRLSPFSSSGEPHLLLVVDNVTERVLAEQDRRKLEAQVQHTQKLDSLGILTGGIAHDFNNILTGLLGNTDLALRALPADSPLRPFLGDIQKAGRQAADLTSQMLTYSGKGTLVMDDVDINALVGDLASLLQSAVSKKAALSYELSADLPAVTADATQLRQLVLNLVTNASEAVGDEAGRVRIRTYATDYDRAGSDSAGFDGELAAGRYVTIEVSDTGCGMAEETRAKIFAPFFTTKLAGHGLGLAAVQGIIHRHQGAILVETEPGQGTTFKVLLPALDRLVTPVTTRTKGEDDWQGTGTILLVDDEAMIREVAAEMLKQLGFSVLTASDGTEAVDVFRAHAEDIACVLLDLNMPRMDGEETFDGLRDIRDDVPIILSSGYSEQESTERLGDKGLAGFLQKPYETTQLQAKLREILSD